MGGVGGETYKDPSLKEPKDVKDKEYKICYNDPQNLYKIQNKGHLSVDNG